MKGRHAVRLDASNHLVHEALTRGIHDAHRSILLQQRASNGVHQVRLSHTNAAVDEQRIVAARWAVRYRAGRGVRKLVARTDHEVIETEPAVKLAGGRSENRFQCSVTR